VTPAEPRQRRENQGGDRARGNVGVRPFGCCRHRCISSRKASGAQGEDTGMPVPGSGCPAELSRAGLHGDRLHRGYRHAHACRSGGHAR
jgi:hypothetical protein